MSRPTTKERIEHHLNGLVAAALLGEVPLREFEDILRRRVIRAALHKHNNVISRAAKELKLDRDALRRRIVWFGIPLPPRSVARSASNARRRAA
jgi:transcriptional regulator with GAF, ATPase, and Fis domain